MIVRCPACDKRSTCPGHAEGRLVRCKCGREFLAGPCDGRPGAPTEEYDPAPRPRRPAPPPSPTEDFPADPPRRKPRSASEGGGVKVWCPHCGTPGEVAAGHVGKSVRCGACNRGFVPGQEELDGPPVTRLAPIRPRGSPLVRIFAGLVLVVGLLVAKSNYTSETSVPLDPKDPAGPRVHNLSLAARRVEGMVLGGLMAAGALGLLAWDGRKRR